MDCVGSQSTFGDRVAAIVGAMLAGKGLAPVGPGDSLREAGLSSLDQVNLMLSVEETFELMLPPEVMTPDNFQSIAAIAALIGRLA